MVNVLSEVKSVRHSPGIDNKSNISCVNFAIEVPMILRLSLLYVCIG